MGVTNLSKAISATEKKRGVQLVKPVKKIVAKDRHVFIDANLMICAATAACDKLVDRNGVSTAALIWERLTIYREH